MLVHNAECMSVSPLLRESLGAIADVVQTNVHFPVALTRLLAPIIARRNGGVRHKHRMFNAVKLKLGDINRNMTVMTSQRHRHNNILFAGINSDVVTSGDEINCEGGSGGGAGGSSGVKGGGGGGGGRILFISTLLSGSSVHCPSPVRSVFAASKAFLTSFAQVIKDC